MSNWLRRYGQTPLPADQEAAFQLDMQFGPGWSNWRRDFIRQTGQQPNTSPGGDYNYRGAWLAGAKPEYHAPSDSYHGMSSGMVPPYQNPVNFKSQDHPTMWKEHFMRRFGFDPDDPNAPWSEGAVTGLLGYLNK